MLMRRAGQMDIKVFDYKTIVDRQVIPPRFVPLARRLIMRQETRAVLGQLDRYMSEVF